MKTHRLQNQGFALVEMGVLGSAILIILAAGFLFKDRIADSIQSWPPASFPLITTPTAIPEPTVSTPATTFQPRGNYQYLPQSCLQDIKSEDCKTQFKALLDEKCGGQLRNASCEPIRQEIFEVTSERVCQAKPDSGACRCLQSGNFQSQACKDTFKDLFAKIVEGVCQPDPHSQACQCLQDKDFRSPTCKDAYLGVLVTALKKNCPEGTTLPACQCVTASDPEACLRSTGR